MSAGGTPITEDEGELLMDVHLDLERAYHLDPNAPIPWREWRELLGYLDEYFGYAEFQHEEEPGGNHQGAGGGNRCEHCR